MGIPGLLVALKSVTYPTHISEYRGLTAGVDAYCWLHRGAFGCGTEICTGAVTDKYVTYCMRRVNLLRDHAVEPIMVFDGASLPMKGDKHLARRRIRDTARCKGEAALAAGEAGAAAQHFSKAVGVTHDMAFQLMKELRHAGVKLIVAPYEADAQLAYLNRCGAVDVVITEDSDCLPYGCKKVLFKMDNQGHGQEIQLRNLPANTPLALSNWKNSMFLDLCLLVGCDYITATVKGLGIATAHKIVERHRSLDKIVRAVEASKFDVPAGYWQQYKRARLTFRHHIVYDTNTARTTHLLPLGETAKEIGNLDFLGSHLLSPAVVQGVVSGRLLPTNHQPYESYPTEAVTSRRASPLLCASSTAPTGSDVRRPLTVTESGNSAKTTRREDPYSNLVMAQDLLNESRETSQESYSHCSEANRARVSSSLPVLEGVLIDNPFGADRYEVAEVPFVDHGVGKGCLGLSPALRVQHRQEEIQAGRREASAPSEGGDGGHAWLGAGSAFERDSTQMQNAETARSDTHWMPAVMSVPGEPLLDIYSQQIAPSVTEEENASERLCLPSKSDCGFVGTSNWKVARGQEGHIEWAARDDWSDPSASLSSSRDVEWGTKTVAKGVRHPVWGENCGEEEIMNRRPLEGRRLPVQSNSDGCSPESTFGWTRYAPSGAAPEESASSLQEADVTGMNAENVDDGVYRKVPSPRDIGALALTEPSDPARGKFVPASAQHFHTTKVCQGLETLQRRKRRLRQSGGRGGTPYVPSTGSRLELPGGQHPPRSALEDGDTPHGGIPGAWEEQTADDQIADAGGLWMAQTTDGGVSNDVYATDRHEDCDHDGKFSAISSFREGLQRGRQLSSLRRPPGSAQTWESASASLHSSEGKSAVKSSRAFAASPRRWTMPARPPLESQGSLPLLRLLDGREDSWPRRIGRNKGVEPPTKRSRGTQFWDAQLLR